MIPRLRNCFIITERPLLQAEEDSVCLMLSATMHKANPSWLIQGMNEWVKYLDV